MVVLSEEAALLQQIPDTAHKAAFHLPGRSLGHVWAVFIATSGISARRRRHRLLAIDTGRPTVTRLLQLATQLQIRIATAPSGWSPGPGKGEALLAQIAKDSGFSLTK